MAWWDCGDGRLDTQSAGRLTRKLELWLCCSVLTYARCLRQGVERSSGVGRFAAYTLRYQVSM
jgi:hypothetical protein